MTGAMMQGALVDSFSRFPLVAKLVLTLFGKQIDRIIADTKINERYSIELVERLGSHHLNYLPSPSSHPTEGLLGRLTARISILAFWRTENQTPFPTFNLQLMRPILFSQVARPARHVFPLLPTISSRRHMH